jgi:hypothetical protein
MTASDLREPTIPQPADMLIAIVNKSSLATNDDASSMTRASGVSVSNFLHNREGRIRRLRDRRQREAEI